MAIDYGQLKTELNTDPLGIGYATAISSGDCTTPATLLSALVGPGAATITLTSVDNVTFVTQFLPYLANVAALSDANKKDLYWNVWKAILAMPSITFGNPSVSGLMAQAVTDGILTAAQAEALTQRTGSRAEVLFGPGTSVSHQDIAQALYRS